MAHLESCSDAESIARARDRYLLQLKRINDILHPDDDVTFEPHAKVRGGDIRCSFCGKADVEKVIAGPTCFICNECVDVCVEIIRKDREQSACESGAARTPAGEAQK